jgi:hypothetical protein
MAIQQDYAKLTAFYNQAYLQQLTSISHKTESGQQPVNLLNEGLGGFTPGSGSCTISLGFTIPIGGTEVPYQQDAANGAYVTFQIGVGSVAYIGTGKIMNVDIGQETGSASHGTCEWHGELKAME